MEIPDKIYLSMIREDTSTPFVGMAWDEPQRDNVGNIEYINKKALIGWLQMLASRTKDEASKVFFLCFIEQLKEF